MKITFFTDLHYSDEDRDVYFNGTQSLGKLNKIIDATPDSDHYISLGDFVDFLRDESPALYEQGVEFVKTKGLHPYDGEIKKKTLFGVVGNHETAFIQKSKLSKFIPYVEGVGSVYSFELGEVLFVAVDASFDRVSGSDAPEIMRKSTDFIFPSTQIKWVSEELKSKVKEGTKSIVWISHVAFKDINEDTRTEMANEFLRYGLPVYIFEGHTHVQNFYEKQTEKGNLKIYNLAPVTFDFTVPVEERENTYFYYTATFNDGNIEKVESFRG